MIKMNKMVIVICCLIFTNMYLFADIKDKEWWELIDYSHKNTRYKKIPLYKSTIDSNVIKIKFIKELESEEYEGTYNIIPASQYIKGEIAINEFKYLTFYKKSSFVYGQRINITQCLDKKENLIIPIVLSYRDFSRVAGFYIQFIPKIYQINLEKKSIKELKDKVDVLKTVSSYSNTIRENTDEKDIDYEYYNNELVLKKLYKVGVCDKEVTNKSDLKENNLNLSEIEKTVKEKKELKIYSKIFFQKLLQKKPIEKKTLTPYNNIAYYLQKANANEEAIYLLKKILEKFPNRTVAHYNLADAYWALGEKKKAKEHYNIYIKQMKAKGKEKRIPKVVKDRVASK